MRVVVTGASGFIGRHLVRALLAQGHRVHVVGRRPDRLERAFSGLQGCRVFPSRRGDPPQDALAGVQAVIHLAARRYGPGAGLWEYLVPNVLSTARLLRRAERAGCSVAVLASTRLVYRPGWNRLPFREDALCLPRTPYGKSKLLMEWVARSISRRARLRVTTLRLSQIYGPGMHPGDLIWTAIQRAKSGLPVVVWGRGRGARDYLHVADAVRAFLLCLPSGVSGVFNVGSGLMTSHRQVARTVAEIGGNRDGWVCDPGRVEDPTRWVLDVTRAREHLGWRPRISLPEGFRDLFMRAG